MADYETGATVRITGTFKAASVAADPSAPTAKYKSPAGTVTTLVYPTDAALVKDGVGVYHFDIDVSEAGTWRYRLSGTGSAKAAGEGTFIARRSGVL